jgi:Putative beta-barrel porin-2, OmpL-like. bbp2/Carboxypeptidase regulatory-like domain
MKPASRHYLKFVRAICAVSLTAVLVPACEVQAQSRVDSDLRSALTAPLSTGTIYTQSMVGDLRGVTRQGLLPMPGVQVVVHNLEQGTDRSVTSGNDGSFLVANLKPGTYRLTATREGFVASSTVTVDLAAGQSLSVNMTLGPNSAVPAHEIAQPAPARASSEPAPAAGTSGTESPAPAKASADPAVPPAVAKELEALEARIAQLEAELTNRAAAEKPAVSTPAPASAAAAPESSSSSVLDASSAANPQAEAPAAQQPEKKPAVEPFSLYDYTWMNGNSRNHDTPLATKYFSPEFRTDTNYILDYNHPVDHTMGGATESFRSGEVQEEQMSFGGDLRVGNVRGRVLTMFGLFATTTPRNDASFGVGQWDLRDAYKYVSEAWGGYHFNVQHGLNIDAGIFVSYIGLFSYYNFDNWAYQPSFVSSNTPWFFNGVRVQWFPTAKLKIEPWFINGWQSYAKFNSRPGLGGQILWRPNGWLSFVFNNYGMGTDTLGNPFRSRIHTDDSVEVKYYDHPDRPIDMMAFSVTGDLGCEYGGGVSCFGRANAPKQQFIGAMAYDRMQFKKDHFGFTVGGGFLNNPGRYLTLLPPINGADAVSGSPYFTANPGNKFHGIDGTVTFDYMPSQFITFRAEVGYRHSDVPYWTGRGGITPPGAVAGTNGAPADYVCANGASSGIGSSGSINADLPSVEAVCSPLTGKSGLSSVWFPDLRRDQLVNIFAVMVKF